MKVSSVRTVWTMGATHSPRSPEWVCEPPALDLGLRTRESRMA